MGVLVVGMVEAMAATQEAKTVAETVAAMVEVTVAALVELRVVVEAVAMVAAKAAAEGKGQRRRGKLAMHPHTQANDKKERKTKW